MNCIQPLQFQAKTVQNSSKTRTECNYPGNSKISIPIIVCKPRLFTHFELYQTITNSKQCSKLRPSITGIFRTIKLYEMQKENHRTCSQHHNHSFLAHPINFLNKILNLLNNFRPPAPIPYNIQHMHDTISVFVTFRSIKNDQTFQLYRGIQKLHLSQPAFGSGL